MNNLKPLLQTLDQTQTKIQSLRPLKPGELTQLKEYFKIGLTYSSNALEGNSLTETETKVVIEDGITIGGKPVRDHLEAIGHSEAFDHLYNIYQNQEITEQNINQLHNLFYHHIDPENSGTYRTQKVIVSGSKYIFPNPEKVPDLMKNLIKTLPQLKKDNHPAIFAAKLHLQFLEIHPYIDGNGRVARLLLNLSLLQSGYPITIIPPILRKDYIDTLEKAHFKNQEPFLSFICQQIQESQKEYLKLFAN